LEFSSSSWLSLSFLILDSKVGSVVTKVCFGFFCCDFLLILAALSLVGGQSVYRVHCPNLVLFYFILGVFAPQNLDRPHNRESESLIVYFYIPAASNLSRT